MSTMSWKEMGVGLISMVVGLGALVGAVNLLPKDTALRAAGMIGLATAMVILGAALKIMATLSWNEVAKSLVALAGSLAILAVAMNFMTSAIPGAAAMLIVAPALVILSSALKTLGGMSWGEIAKGLVMLGGSLAIIAIAMNLMTAALPGAAALLVVSAALAVLTPVLMNLGSMSWGEIARGLVAIAGAFAVMGVAALVLQPLVPTILSLSAALALLGVACAAIGVGAIALGAGLASIAASGAAAAVALTVIVSSIIGLIPYLIEQIGVGIIKLCEVIAGSAAAICDAVTVIIVAIVDALVASVPHLVDGAFVLISELLNSLVEYTPMIVTALFDFLIGILDSIAAKLPELIQSGVNLLMSFFQGVVDALKNIDPSVLINGLVAVGVLTAIVVAMAAVALLTPAAMVGVLGMGAVVTELAIVLAAIGALAQIPGLAWLVSEGGDFMQTIGTAIGQFLGGIAGGFAQGMSASLPKIGSDLSAFMTNAMPFITGAKMIDASTLDGVKSLVGIIAALTAVDILDGLTSWLTGGSSLTKFGQELAAFAPSIKAYADTVAGIDASAVTASATAAQALAAMTSNIPNEGGMVAWFTGENSIAKFGTELVVLGNSLSAYSNAITGFNAEAVIASANAASALADMTSNIPNEGGMVAWFTGENSISKFGSELVTLGTSLAMYSTAITGFNADAVIASANAASALVTMTSNIPNEGGMVAWFTGENSISKFGNELVILGNSLSAYSDAISGFNADAVIASTNAASALVDMTSNIPNEGGMVAWFTGENSVSKFGNDLVTLGNSLAMYSMAITGFNADAVIASANAASALVTMTSNIPNEGGMVAWFTGENSISKFGTELVVLGNSLSAYSNSIVGFNAEAVIASANAASALVDMTSNIPNEGGMVAWFTGENSVASFASRLPLLGAGLLAFSTSATGVNNEAVLAATNAAKALVDLTAIIPNESGMSAWFTGENSVANFAGQLPLLGAGLLAFSMSVTGVNIEAMAAATNAAKSLVSLTASIPNEGGMMAWFAGENSVASFASQLPLLGTGLKSFSTAVEGINAENITAAAGAAKALAQMASYIPNEGGLVAWFTGDNSVASFAGNLPALGTGLKAFSDSVAGINAENITAAANAAKVLAQMANSAPADMTKLTSFGTNLETFGASLKAYSTTISGVGTQNIAASADAINKIKGATAGLNPTRISSAASAIDELVASVKKMSSIQASTADGFSAAMKKIADTGIDSMVNSFKSAGGELQNVGGDLVSKFAKGANSKSSEVSKTAKALITKFTDGLKNSTSNINAAGQSAADAAIAGVRTKYTPMYYAGSFLVDGFVKGIDYNKHKATAAGQRLAALALEAARRELDEHSPSKAMYEIGDYAGQGFVNALYDYGSTSYDAASEMAALAKDGIRTAVGDLGDMISSDIDMQPTISPVFDMNSIEHGVGKINRLLDFGASVNMHANVDGISSMMNRRGQNGANNDIVSELGKLRRELANMPRESYNINGVTYDDGSNIKDFAQAVVRQARIERRV